MERTNTRLECRTHRVARAATLVSLLLLIAGGAWAQAGTARPVTDENLVERISQAKTPADHQAIATYYQAQAAAAAAKVKEHDAMLKAYGNLQGRGKAVMQEHCEALMRLYKEQQKQNEDLAKEHAAMAAAVAK